MKIKVLLAAALALVVSISASAQKNLPADFTRDGFVTAGVGANMTFEGLLSHNFQGGIAPVVDLTIGRWCTPSVGFRVGYQGWKTRCSGNWQNNSSAHVDVLWNAINTFSYDKDRVYSVAPYIALGFMSGSKTTTSLTAGVGLLNVFRLTDIVALDLDLDLRANYVNGVQFNGDGKSAIASAAFGVMLTIPSAR